MDQATARRFLVARHLLAPPRGLPADPASVLHVMDRLGSLQFDPLEVTGRNHDLVLAARIAGYQRAWTDEHLYGSRVLYETYNKGLSIVPTAQLPWYRITWDQNRDEHGGAAFDVHAPLVEELLDRIRRDGPLSSTDMEPRTAIDWYWRPTNPVRAILEALAEAGVLGLARREGNRRVYDLVERLFPEGLLAERPPERDQRRHKLLSRYRAHGLLGRSGNAELWYGTAPAVRKPDGPAEVTRRELLDGLVEDGTLIPVVVDGVRGERFMLAAESRILASVASVASADSADSSASSDSADSAGSADLVVSPGPGASGVAFLAPLDPFVWDRDFLRALYDFDYVWEVYVPAAKRRWGYYVLPVLFGDQLVGRIEPRIDRKAGALRILDMWWEAGFDPLAEAGFADALVDALEAHARLGGVGRVVLPRGARHRGLAGSLRARLGRDGRIRDRF